jgi:NAD(P)H-dependent FMN reductase
VPAMPKLGLVVCSTRPNRIGPSIAVWFEAKARAHGKLEPVTVDLKEINLPPMDEPNHPFKRQYQHEHTKAWSKLVESLDAFTFITPEYNYGMAPALLNAFDYVSHEWAYKAACHVSYGGVSGGTRSVQMSKLVITSLKMMPIPEGIFIPFAAKLVTEGRFDPGTTQDEAVTRMLDELVRWTTALEVLRRPG